MPSAITIAAYGAGLLLTLCLAARFTPRAWWRRANARALALLVGGTALFGSLVHGFFEPDTLLRAGALPALHGAVEAPVAGRHYRVREHLNLREDTGINARRLAVVPAGTQVTATGAHRGDWWQLSAEVDGRRFDGWASSLWLRRADEAGQASSGAARRMGL